MNGLSPDHLMQGVAAGHVIVNADNPLNDITMDQLEAIYTGKTTEWKAIYR